MPWTPESLRELLAKHDVLCPGCNYNLRGCDGTVCPECGLRIDPDEWQLQHIAPVSLQLSTVLAGLGIGIALSIMGALVTLLMSAGNSVMSMVTLACLGLLGGQVTLAVYWTRRPRRFLLLPGSTRLLVTVVFGGLVGAFVLGFVGVIVTVAWMVVRLV